jgi:hypothetical protein
VKGIADPRRISIRFIYDILGGHIVHLAFNDTETCCTSASRLAQLYQL